MMFNERIFLGNTVRDWLTALLITTGVLAALWMLVRVVLRRLAAFARRTETDIDDLVAYVGAQTRLGLLAIPALYIGSLVLSLPEAVATWFRVVAWTVFLVQVAVWGDALIDFWLKDYREEVGEEDADRLTTVGALTFVVRLCLYALVVLLALDNIPGIQVTALIGSLGISGIAVALAVQNVLGDLFASLSIALDKPFVLGDFIEVGDESGTVEHIGLKTTRIRRLSGEQLVVGNNDLLQSRIRNYGRMGERRVVFSVAVAGETPHEKLKRIPSMLREILESQPQVRFGRTHFNQFGDFSLDFEVVYYLQDPDYDLYMDTQQAINLAILQRFAEEGIQIPYPTQAVYVAQQEPQAKGKS
jgi:small-conductance mechanosensitive channel